ncbi:hypothetical protein GCM10025868_35780 [Angustibacter aerolatus]|uniref:Iron transporter n=1 Tax=Angustibacter aerolatus TaxID=1162965 RepID=A0ABQ6JK04_9ACTN|nr:hypothetical protein GCM10025868_35780 [Angustibacter aerolatus]
MLGLAVAIALGYAVYRGGVRINLSRFFTATGVVLVVVAGGLLMTAVHTAHEAGWVNVGQQTAFDASALVSPGTPQAALVTGVLGLQPQPTVIEVAAWAVYVAVMLAVVLWPKRRRPAPAPLVRAHAGATS